MVDTGEKQARLTEHEHQEFELTDLLMPRFTGTKDDFGKEVVAPLPLTLDRVLEGRKPVSKAMLFSLPYEIIAQILQNVPKECLTSLALVNSDCRQMARSRQFASLCWDYGPHTKDILLLLLKESAERMRNGGVTKKPALGPCIRRVTVAAEPYWIKALHNIDVSQEFYALPKAEQSSRLGAGRENYFGSYLASIQLLLGFSRIVMPHLELFDWRDSVSLPSEFYESIVKSTIKHFKVDRAGVSEPFLLALSKNHAWGHWPLQSLDIEVNGTLSTSFSANVAPLCTSLLRACAPTLVSLTWCHFLGGGFRTERLAPFPAFPSLRHLRLGHGLLGDAALLKRLIHDELVSLDCDPRGKNAVKQFFQDRGCVPGLKTFVCQIIDWNRPENQSLSFIEANPQLSKLAFTWALSKSLMENRLLPLLVHSFHNLKSLDIRFVDRQITSSAMEQIGKLTSLEQLHLSAGEQLGWKHEWPIEHSTMRKYLSSLSLLKRLACSRDSYDNGVAEGVERYYVSGLYARGDNVEITRKEFEAGHISRMLHQAVLYVKELPQLEWLYFGQIPMAVVRPDRSGQKTVKALSHERDECLTLLGDMFGWEGIFPSF